MIPKELAQAWLECWPEYQTFSWDGEKIVLYYPNSAEPWSMREYAANTKRYKSLRNLTENLKGEAPFEISRGLRS